MTSASSNTLLHNVDENCVMQPQASVCISMRPIRILKDGMHPGDEAIFTRIGKGIGLDPEVSHAIIDSAWWGFEWSISNLYSLGAKVREEFSIKVFDNGMFYISATLVYL